MKTFIKCFIENGDYWETWINASEQEAANYYLGKTFNVGIGPHDNMQRVVRCEIDGKEYKMHPLTINPKDDTLTTVLAKLGYEHRPLSMNKRTIHPFCSDEIVFAGNAGETWEWLRKEGMI